MAASIPEAFATAGKLAKKAKKVAPKSIPKPKPKPRPKGAAGRTAYKAKMSAQAKASSKAKEAKVAMDTMHRKGIGMNAGVDLNRAGGQIAKNFQAQGGMKKLAGTATRSAIGGAAVGGVLGVASGEDPWESAAKGAVVGGMGGAAVRGSRMGMNVGKGASLSKGIADFDGSQKVSQSVQTLMRSARDSDFAKKAVLNKKGRGSKA